MRGRRVIKDEWVRGEWHYAGVMDTAIAKMNLNSEGSLLYWLRQPPGQTLRLDLDRELLGLGAMAVVGSCPLGVFCDRLQEAHPESEDFCNWLREWERESIEDEEYFNQLQETDSAK